MTTLLLVIQVIIVISLIGIILMQKTGTDSLAGLSGSGHSLFSNKSTSNILSKITIVLAILFVFNSLLVAKVINAEHKHFSSMLDDISNEPSPQKKLEAPELGE